MKILIRKTYYGKTINQKHYFVGSSNILSNIQIIIPDTPFHPLMPINMSLINHKTLEMKSKKVSCCHQQIIIEGSIPSYLLEKIRNMTYFSFWSFLTVSLQLLKVNQTPYNLEIYHRIIQRTLVFYLMTKIFIVW